MSRETQALLERLVGQFASPYDFLRELVQNAMDAGSDLVEVELHQHRGDDASQVVFELVVVDSGAGMDEEIIDGELTRLFGTSKADDRTMAGGFGIGFVSVFAWEPERVLVQTGRQGQAWELLFHQDARFEKRPVEMPLEGTTIRLFRSGAPSQRRAIAEAVEDALRRWCRFVPIEVSFEDFAAGTGRQELSEDFTPHDVAVRVARERGPTRAELAFGAQAETILMRRGLVLEEGRTADMLPLVAKAAGAASIEHLVVRLDSPRLQTGLARDGAIHSRDRAALEQELVPSLTALREALAERLSQAAGVSSWDVSAANLYSHLHAHLQLEHEHIDRLEHRALLRLVTGAAVSVETLVRRARLGLVAVADEDPPQRRLLALRSGVPVLQGRWDTDGGWLGALLGRFGLKSLPLSSAVSSATALQTPEALARLTLELLRDVAALKGLQWAVLADAGPEVLGGVEIAEAGVVIGAEWTPELFEGRVLWLQASHPVVRRASSAANSRPEAAALGLAIAILSRSGAKLEPVLDRWRSWS